jgi:hypothetical protein
LGLSSGTASPAVLYAVGLACVRIALSGGITKRMNGKESNP